MLALAKNQGSISDGPASNIDVQQFYLFLPDIGHIKLGKTVLNVKFSFFFLVVKNTIAQSLKKL